MKKIRFVKQDGKMDCGVASLLMILRTYGGNCSMEYLRTLTNTTTNGTTAYDLLKAGEKFSLTSFGLKGNLEELPSTYLPVIAHIVKEEYHHFVVIYEIDLKKRKVVIADPAKSGITKESIEDFKKKSTNHFLIFIPNGNVPSLCPTNALKGIFLKFIKKHKKTFLALFILSVVYTLTSIISSFHLSLLLNLINHVPYLQFIIICLFFTLISLIRYFTYYFRFSICIKILKKFDSSLFSSTYHHLFSLPNSYYQTRTIGEITSRINDLSSLRTTVIAFLCSLVMDCFLALTALLFLFWLQPLLTFIVLLFLILEAIFFLAFKRKIKNSISTVKEKEAKYQSYLIDTLKQVDVIRRLKRIDYITSKMNIEYDDYWKSQESYQFLNNRISLFKNMASSVFQILFFAIGIFLISMGMFNLSSLFTYFILLSYLTDSFDHIFDFLFNYEDSKEAIRRVEELYEVEEEKEEKPFPEKLETIFLQDLAFSLHKQRKIFSNWTMSLEKNDKVLLYGKSGSGKSTLSKILAGFESGYEGKILVNNHLLKNEEEKKLKEHVTYIAQNEGLLNKTLRENIVLGREVDEEKFQKICKICRVDRIASKHPLMYDRMVEEDGANLSGGEIQRVILARSLLKESDVYILDESLCNIDLELEREILKDLFSYLNEKIVMVISHRFYNEDLYNKKIHFERGE